jgi:hypothetical protein
MIRRRCRLALFAVILAGVAGPACSVLAQQSKPAEYEVKAVYLYNFSKFIEWPPASFREEAFTICVLGHDPFGPLLDATLAGETIGNKKPAARRVASAREAANCQILFVASSEAGRVKQILASIDKPGVLTVSDLPDFMASGGMIQFVLQDNKIRFEVNLTAAGKSGLILSSQLLKVAVSVRKEPPGENVNQ